MERKRAEHRAMRETEIQTHERDREIRETEQCEGERAHIHTYKLSRDPRPNSHRTILCRFQCSPVAQVFRRISACSPGV